MTKFGQTDRARKPHSIAAMTLRALIRFYQIFLSPLLPANCRYWPSCSNYAKTAVRTHGAGKGAWLALRRIARCHPWGGCGYDPVPGDPETRTSRNGELEHHT